MFHKFSNFSIEPEYRRLVLNIIKARYWLEIFVSNFDQIVCILFSYIPKKKIHRKHFSCQTGNRGGGGGGGVFFYSFKASPYVQVLKQIISSISPGKLVMLGKNPQPKIILIHVNTFTYKYKSLNNTNVRLQKSFRQKAVYANGLYLLFSLVNTVCMG